MGNCFGTVEFIVNNKIPGQDQVAYDLMKKIFLTDPEISRFYAAYCDIDADSSGFIRADEFRAYFRMEKTAFSEKVFSIFDSDGSGFLNFFEFVCSLWNFLSLDPNDLGLFVFYLFDDDHTGTLDFKEIRKMLEVIHGKGFEENAGMQRVVTLMRDSSNFLSQGEFLVWCRKHAMLTNPILQQQLKLQKELLGDQFWAHLTEKRKEHPEMADPSFILKVSETAERLYKSIEAKLKAQSRIENMQETVLNKTRSSRDDEKTQRRNSLILGMMHLRDNVVDATKSNRRVTTINVDKYRDAEQSQNGELESTVRLPQQQRRRRSLIRPDLSTLISNDAPVHIESVEETSEKKSKKKSKKSPTVHVEANIEKQSTSSSKKLPPLKSPAKYKPH